MEFTVHTYIDLGTTNHPTLQDALTWFKKMEHVAPHCPRFTAPRARLEAFADIRLTPENIVEFTLESKKVWEIFMNSLGRKETQGKEEATMSRSELIHSLDAML